MVGKRQNEPKSWWMLWKHTQKKKKKKKNTHTKVSKSWQQNNSETVTNENDKEIT